MSFRMKLAAGVLLICMLAFDGMALFLMHRSTRLNLERERARALGEHYQLAQRAQSQLVGLSDGDDIEPRLRAVHGMLAQGLAGSGARLFWYMDGGPVVVDSPIPEEYAAPLLAQAGRATAVAALPDGQTLLTVGRLSAPFERYQLVAATSLAPLERMNWQLGRSMGLFSAVTSALLLLLVLLLVSRLLGPMKALARAARGIEQGDYGRPVPSRGRGELADLARAFNAMAATVQRQMGELREMAGQKQRFADNLAHEMRTPLTAIEGYARTLMQQPLSDVDRRRALGYIASEGARMRRMSEALLQLSAAGRAPIQVERVLLSRLFERAMRSAAPELDPKRLHVDIEIKLESLLCDPAMIESLLVNLLVNAARASSEGGRIMMCARMERGAPALLVADEGRGMTERQLARATEPFYRTDKARARRDGGAGLGLSLVKQIADCHGARFEIESKPGVGTAARVVFTTPLQPGEYLATEDGV